MLKSNNVNKSLYLVIFLSEKQLSVPLSSMPLMPYNLLPLPFGQFHSASHVAQAAYGNNSNQNIGSVGAISADHANEDSTWEAVFA